MITRLCVALSRSGSIFPNAVSFAFLPSALPAALEKVVLSQLNVNQGLDYLSPSLLPVRTSRLLTWELQLEAGSGSNNAELRQMHSLHVNQPSRGQDRAKKRLSGEGNGFLLNLWFRLPWDW